MFPAVSSTAQDHVWWDDDGTVDLRLGSHYDDSIITVDQEQLGALFGQNRRPFAGETVTILVPDSGRKGGISGPIHALKPVWEALSGARLDVVAVPIADLYNEIMLDLKNDQQRYDGMIVSAFFYGDLIAGDYLRPIDPYLSSEQYPRWSYGSMPPSLRHLHRWQDNGYGVLNDADSQILYYRRDVLNDPEWRAAFRDETGEDMVVPPRTWQQLLRISSFFAGKDWDKRDPDPDHGIVLHLKMGEQAHYHFQSLAASFAITPGNRVDQYRNVYWFDPTNMTPLINSEGHVRALDLLKELQATGPAQQIGWNLGQVWDYFLRGKSVFLFSWGDVGALCQDEARSAIKGDCASTIMPSARAYWDHQNAEWRESRSPRSVGNMTGGSWHGVITSYAANPDAVYTLLALMALKPVSIWNARYGWTGVDPGSRYQFPEPIGDARLSDYVKAGWHEDDITDYARALYENFMADTILPYLRIEGVPEYWDIMDRNLWAAISGDKTAKEALDDTAASWDTITDRLGRDKILKQYQESIGFEG